MLDFLIVIPARYKSSRLPGKPLIKLDGVPMLVRTFKQCIKCAPIEKIVVATDDQRIVKLCNSEKIPVIIKNLDNDSLMSEQIRKIRSEIVYNIGNSAKLGAEIIEKIYKESN